MAKSAETCYEEYVLATNCSYELMNYF